MPYAPSGRRGRRRKPPEYKPTNLLSISQVPVSSLTDSTEVTCVNESLLISSEVSKLH
jgi:hypothetical protein